MPKPSYIRTDEITEQNETALPDVLACLVAEANEFLELDFKNCHQHSWFGRCISVREVKTYLKKHDQSVNGIFAKNIAKATAQAFSGLGSFDSNLNPFPKARIAQQMQGWAINLTNALSREVWTPKETKTKAFQDGLASLHKIYPCRRKTGESGKGNPQRRKFIDSIARLFYRNFKDIPIRVIEGLTGIAWDSIDERSVRNVLTSERKQEIFEEEAKKIVIEEKSITQTGFLMNRLSVPIEKTDQPNQVNIQTTLMAVVENIKLIPDIEFRRDLLNQIRKSCIEYDYQLDQNLFN